MRLSNIGNIHSIETMGLLDGPGVRTIFFLQGCPLRCQYCHNPDSQAFEPKRSMSPEDTVQFAKRYQPYYGKEGGVTFSGGEPLAQMDYLLETLPLLKDQGIHVAIDTSGFTDYEKLKELLPYVDLFLLDVKAFSDADYKKVTERPMGPFEKFMETLIEENYQGRVWIRHVMVEGWSDSEDDMDRLWATVEKLAPWIDQIDILPYHTMGVDKYEALGRTYALKGVPPMDKDRAKELENYVNKKLEDAKSGR